MGSGPSGLITAYLLSKKNFKVDVFEASAKVGGLAQSIELWGQKVEIGPHFLNYDDCKPIKALITELFHEKEILKFERNTNIFIKKNQTFSYPPTFKTIVKGLSAGQFLKSVISLLNARLKKTGIHHNAESAMIAIMGEFLYIFFFKEYSEKLWSIPCNELDACYCRALLPLKKENTLSNLFNFSKTGSNMFILKMAFQNYGIRFIPHVFKMT